MADDNEDTLLASMKEAIAAEKGETESKATEPEQENEPDIEEDANVDEAPEKSENKPEIETDTDEDEEPTRGQTRHQKLANQLKEEREERARDRADRDKLVADNARKDAELENYRNQQNHIQSQAERRAEEQRLELLTPEEKQFYQANQKASQLEQRLNHMERERQDDRERSEFRSKANQDPLVEKYADRVEQMRQDDIKRLGVAAPRDAYLNFIVGEAI